ncbi:MAG: bifunctional acetate--CoA ligase family protein/GNAT family N-acetyltransferase [Proteobacteria bacterium]|nr:bifunctional acetate--CoA ligase family protein/GNAT family N-acetyltransferase [Pseudomonadota bacterium]
MTIRNLDAMFRAKSVALIGASKSERSVGAVLASNLFRGGFDGPIMPVNPKHAAIHGVAAYKDVASLPAVPDLAVIATPPDTVPGLIADLGALGTKAAVVITAGFGESREERGTALQQAMLDAAKPHLLRIIGPNCLGIMVPGIGLNAGFGHTAPLKGRLAFVAQSGAVVTSVVDWATSRGIGFSHLASLGDMADVDFGDMLDYLANDVETKAILLYIESVTHARKFLSAARAAARMKPVVVVKAGRHAEGAKAAASHTGAMAGSDAVYDAAFRRAGLLRVRDLEELFAAVETLAMAGPVRGDRLAILTNGGGLGVLATDSLMDEGGRLAELAPETIKALDAVLPPTWSHGNPVDIIGDAPGSRYGDALAALLDDRGVDAVLAINCPTAVASPSEAAEAVIAVAKERPKPAILTSWVGAGATAEAKRMFARNNIPSYETPGLAVRAFMHMATYHRNQEILMETPPSVPEVFSPQVERARNTIAKALREKREWLTEPEAKAVLAAYDIPVNQPRVAATPAEAAAVATEFGGAVALKILSPDITHKSDVGGVVLDLQGPVAVQDAATAMRDRIAKILPDAGIDGFTIQPMVRRPGAYELIVGVSGDAQFGPVILFGHGGIAVEIVNDKALALPPLNMRLAREVMSRTRIYEQLKGYRGHRPVNMDAIALTLIKVSQLVVDLGDVAELDINPLVADAYGVVALDARIRVAPAIKPAAARLTIRPYPKELEELIPLGDGRTLLLRPVRPEDEPSLQAGFANLTSEEIRLRFFVSMATLSHVAAARFTQLDYEREMALILTEPGVAGKTEIYGVVRISADPDIERAEYAVIVRHDMTGMGLGVLLMRRMIDYARKREIGEIFGDVLRENATMLKLCKILGFTTSSIPDEPTQVRVTLKL